MQRLLSPLTTNRLYLRQLYPADNKAVFALRSNAAVNTYIQRPLATTIGEADNFIEAINDGIANKSWMYWAITLKDTQQLIGTICLWHFSPDHTTAEIGYEMHPDYQGKGLMNEAMQTLIRYGFELLQLKTIEAYTQAGNLKSIRLLEKNNFVSDISNNNTGAIKEIKFILQKVIV